MKTTLEIKTNRNTFLFQVDQRESQEKRGEKKLHSLPDLTILPTANSVDVYTNILSIIILPTDLRMETICKKTSSIISDMLVSLSLIKKITDGFTYGQYMPKKFYPLHSVGNSISELQWYLQ